MPRLIGGQPLCGGAASPSCLQASLPDNFLRLPVDCLRWGLAYTGRRTFCIQERQVREGARIGFNAEEVRSGFESAQGTIDGILSELDAALRKRPRQISHPCCNSTTKTGPSPTTVARKNGGPA